MINQQSITGHQKRKRKGEIQMNKLYAEMSYKERLLQDFRENSMLYKFYLWIKKKKLTIRESGERRESS
ncbi:MAG: hypothetical protein ABFQ65_02905 [Nanoarchaeota archaeon]